MAEMMVEFWKGMLVELPLDTAAASEKLQLPSLRELRRKILVKVKYTPPQAMATEPRPAPLQKPAQLIKSKSAESQVVAFVVGLAACCCGPDAQVQDRRGTGQARHLHA